MKVLLGATGAVNQISSDCSWWFTSIKWFCNETGEPRKTILMSCALKLQLQMKCTLDRYFWIPFVRAGLRFKHS